MHTIKIEGVDANLHVANVTGFEALGELFSFEVAFTAGDTSVSFDSVTGSGVLLELRSGADVRRVHGVVARLEHAAPTASRVGYRVRIVPSVFGLSLRRTSRIFQDLATPDIAKRVLADAGISGSGFRLSLEGSYAPRTYCVQHRESDWDFLMRLFEDEGIHTYFEHSESGDVLVIADTKAAHGNIAGDAKVPFRPESGALRVTDCVTSFVVADEMRAGKSTVRDYDFKRPTLKLEGTKAGPSDTRTEVYEDAAGFSTAGAATAKAELRLEELATPRRTAHGAGSIARFVPGATFSLADHPTDGLEGPWLVARVEHRGSEAHFEGGKSDVRYDNDFEVYPADAKVRLPRVTRKPLVHGVQTATVVGPAGEEIHVDSFGRIRVMFHWDRAPASDANTCWIRVVQPWAGAAYGAMFIPRVGHEVLVSFEDGDPDRPIVTSSLYHGVNVPPYVLPAERTKSTIKTNSSPGGGGFNELRFEDKAGSEEIYLHAQKDSNVDVLHDESRRIGHDATLEVQNDRTQNVGSNETIMIGKDETVTIGQNLAETVGSSATLTVGQALTVGVGGATVIQLGQALTQVIGGAMTIQVQGESSEAYDKGATEHVSKAKSVTVGDNFSLSVQKDHAIAVDGKSTEDVGSDKTVTVGSTYQLKCGDATVTVKKNGDIQIKGKQITIEGSGPIKVSGSKLDIKSDGAVKVQASGSVKVSGSSVDVN